MFYAKNPKKSKKNFKKNFFFEFVNFFLIKY